MTFVQIIEYTTSRPDEMRALTDEWWSATEGRRQVIRSVLGVDRERPDRYVELVEFPSYERAMENSALPETTALAERIASLCDSPPSFRNLDVIGDIRA
jgi:hypothetical protein